MNSRLVSSTEIRGFIRDVISDEKTRYKKISNLTLEQVEAYIDWIEQMQPYILTTFEEFLKLPSWQRPVKNDRYELVQTIAPQYKELGKDIQPKLIELLSELRQQKRYHEKKNKLLKTLSQKVIIHKVNKMIDHFGIEKNNVVLNDSLDEDEKSAGQKDKESKTILDINNQSIKEAQDVVALEALESVEGILRSFRESESRCNELESQFTILQKQKMEEDKVLESSLAQVEQLQIDVRNLQTQLAEAREQRNYFKTLDHKNQNKTAEQKKEFDRVMESNKTLEEQNKKLLSQLQAQKEGKPITSSIQREMMSSVLERYTPKKFFFNSSEPTLDKLRRISQSSQQNISLGEY